MMGKETTTSTPQQGHELLMVGLVHSIYHPLSSDKLRNNNNNNNSQKA